MTIAGNLRAARRKRSRSDGSLSQLAEACARHPGEPFDEDFARHLGFPNTPILEDDGRFDNPEAVLVDAISQFNLEGVPLRFDAIQVDAL